MDHATAARRPLDRHPGLHRPLRRLFQSARDAEDRDEGENCPSLGKPELLLRELGQNAPFDPDHASDECIHQNEKKELGQIGAQA